MLFWGLEKLFNHVIRFPAYGAHLKRITVYQLKFECCIQDVLLCQIPGP